MTLNKPLGGVSEAETGRQRGSGGDNPGGFIGDAFQGFSLVVIHIGRRQTSPLLDDVDKLMSKQPLTRSRFGIVATVSEKDVRTDRECART